MIAVVILVVVVLLLVAIPWRQLTPAGRLWVVAACLNTMVFFSMPTTAATSPRRPVVGRVLAASAGVSSVLLLVGVTFTHRRVLPDHSPVAWLALLIIGALPGVFYAFFWAIGPVY